MKRYFKAFQNLVPLNSVVFLGDLFDGVTNYMHQRFHRTEFTDPEYLKLKKRWDWVFPVATDEAGLKGRKEKEEEKVRESKLEVLNLAGNHDIGFNIPPEEQRRLVDLFKKYSSC